MSLIHVNNLTFAYPGSYDTIFEHVSFNIDTNWKLGFIGRNGRGKTTFLNLLLNKYEYEGKITASVSFEYFPFVVADGHDTTIDIIDEMGFEYQLWRLMRELNILQVSEDVLYRPFATLSNGEQTKVMLAALFLKENSFLLIDEPTNHLDAAGREIVSEYLKNKSGFILVSHDRYFLDACVDHILCINKSNIELERGNFSSWLVNKERRDNFEQAQNERLVKEMKRLEETAKEKADWSASVEKTKYATRNSGLRPDRGYIGHKAAKMMKRAKVMERRREDAMEEKSRLLKNIESAENLKLSQLSYHATQYVVLDNIMIQYQENIVCSHVSFAVQAGERISLKGRNGCGKSSIVKLICGEDIPHTGNLSKGANLKISYVSQDTSHLRGSLTDYARQHMLEESLFKAILRKLDFERVQFEKDISAFSGGQKKKVLLAKSLCEKSHLLVWDEPLNFIDVISRMQIETLLLEYKPTILFVEHDQAFCTNVATKIVEL